MENLRIVTTILICLMSLSASIAAIATKPSVTEVVVGGSTFLYCSNDNRQNISWLHTQFGSTHETFIYRNDAFHPSLNGRFNMEKNEANGAYKMVISPAKIRDAGIYRCQKETGKGSIETAQLIVLESCPVCEPQMDMYEIVGPNNCGVEPNQLVLSCTATYHGNEAPIMEWRRASDNFSVSEGVTHKIINNNRIAYNLTIKGDSAAKEGDFYFCNTTRPATSSVGCKSGKIKTTGKVVECSTCRPACIASEICQPYIKPYIDAIICIFLIILPAAIAGTILILWCLKIHKREKNLQKGPTQEDATTEDEYEDEDPSSIIEENDRHFNETEGEQLLDNLSRLEGEAEQSADQISQKSDEIERLQEINKACESEITQLKARVSYLERSLYPTGDIDYTKKPTLARTIITRAEYKGRRKPINGLTILSKELFVLFENSSMIEVYDSETFQFIINWEMSYMSHPMDIASCKTSNCIYVIHQEDNALKSEIVKLKPKGNCIIKWSTDGKNGRLSTYKSNVIVCLHEKQLINEYSGDGKLVHTVRLAAAGFKQPWHAIKVTSSHFAVCDGRTKDELRRVCVVDAEEKIIYELREWEGNMVIPVYLVEDSERSILVADRNNQQIWILNCFLKIQGILINKENGLVGHPTRMCLDETKAQLFVAENTSHPNKKDWKDGRILIYNIK